MLHAYLIHILTKDAHNVYHRIFTGWYHWLNMSFYAFTFEESKKKIATYVSYI